MSQSDGEYYSVQQEGDQEKQKEGDQEYYSVQQERDQHVAHHQGIILTSRSDLFKISKLLSEWTCYQIKKKSRWWNETQSEGAFACFWDCTLRAFSWNLCVSSI
jgi:hypothetical protein